jgi:hypothetical protein
MSGPGSGVCVHRFTSGAGIAPACAEVSLTHLSELENGDIAPGIDLVDRPARALGAAAADLLPAATAPDSLPVLREQAEHLFGALMETGDRETFLWLNPFPALLVEAAGKRR